MTELERHIQYLLLDNDCVIVPGFGGFMAHRMPAKYDRKNNLFIPPSRTIGFNPRLTMNDSLLAQAYANCYDISYPEALRHIESDVDILKRTIEQEGGHDICGIGRITINDNGLYDFTPNDSGFVNPGLYGFDTFEINPISQEESDETDCIEEEMPASVSAPVMPTPVLQAPTLQAESQISSGKSSEASDEEPTGKEEKEIALRIPLRLIHQIAAACIALIIFVAFPAKLGDSSNSNIKHGAMDTSLLYSILPKEITSGKPDRLIPSSRQADTPDKAKSENQTKEPTDTPQQETIKPKAATQYAIVIASRVSKKNAYIYVEGLHNKGYKDARVDSSDGLTKVIYKEFATKAEAQATLKALEGNGLFSGCWITEIR